MVEVTVEIINSTVEVTATFPLIGMVVSAIDEGNSTTTYTTNIVEL